MTAKKYSLGKNNLYYFYRFIILPWEFEWVDMKFLMGEGDFRKYCQENSINIKSFESVDKLDVAISTKYEVEKSAAAGILWFVRNDTKPKDTLRHLRNCFAHGNFIKNQKNRVTCISIENVDKGRVKAKGFMPINKLEGLVYAANSCKI